MAAFSTSRRSLLGALPVTLAGFSVGGGVAAGTREAESDDYAFEVTRSEAEWRARLSEDEYLVLREGATEEPRSDPLWDSVAPGMYCCKGCNLLNFDARWKVVLDKGWLFYRQSERDSVMTAIDRTVYDRFARRSADATGPIMADATFDANLSPEEQDVLDSFLAIEVHCRRCASHLGHLLWVDRKLLYCVNGTSLTFAPEAT